MLVLCAYMCVWGISTHKSINMHTMEVRLNNYLQDAATCVVSQIWCWCEESVVPSAPVRSLPTYIGANWSRHKLITIIHWSNWPGPDRRVATDWLFFGSILWSEVVAAETEDAEERGGMFSNAADKSSLTAQFLGVL